MQARSPPPARWAGIFLPKKKLDKLKLVHRTTRAAGLAGDSVGSLAASAWGREVLTGWIGADFWVEEGEGRDKNFGKKYYLCSPLKLRKK